MVEVNVCPAAPHPPHAVVHAGEVDCLGPWAVLKKPWRVLSHDDLLPTMAAHTAAPPIPMPPMPSTVTPIFRARNFAYEPCPPILPHPIDAAWVVSLALTTNAVPGMCKCLMCQWEATNLHLFCLAGNRADLPNVPPKTWGSLPRMEDTVHMHHLEHRTQHAHQNAVAFGLTLTELILSGPLPVLPCTEDDAHNAVARADAYQYTQEAMAMVVGYGPLMKTLLNTPSPKWRPWGFQLPPLHAHTPTLPPTLKCKLDKVTSPTVQERVRVRRPWV